MQAPKEKEQWIRFFNQLHQGTAAELFDIQLVDIDAEHIVLEMPIGPGARQPMGLLHGGVSLLLAETAASIHACWGVDLSQVNPVGIEINGSHLNSARDGHARAIGQVLRRSRVLIFHQVDIEHIESGRQLCSARVTNYYRPLPAAKGGE